MDVTPLYIYILWRPGLYRDCRQDSGRFQNDSSEDNTSHDLFECLMALPPDL